MTLRRDFVTAKPRFCVSFARRLTGVSAVRMVGIDVAINKAELVQEACNREGDVLLPSHGLVGFFSTHEPHNKKPSHEVERLFAYLDEVTKADPECHKNGITVRICVRDDADGPQGLFSHLQKVQPALFAIFSEKRTFDR